MPKLSELELKILRAIANGRSFQEIAVEFELSVSSVSCFVSMIRKKFLDQGRGDKRPGE